MSPALWLTMIRVSGVLSVFFFFQAEDGIRDDLVTGVQTCALPIFRLGARPSAPWPNGPARTQALPRRRGPRRQADAPQVAPHLRNTPARSRDRKSVV